MRTLRNWEEVNILKIIHNKVSGDSPKIVLNVEKKLQDSILELIDKDFIESAHDISEGGIICALAECCIINEENPIGAIVNIPIKSREDFTLFSESQSRVVVSVQKNKKDKFETYLRGKNQPFYFLGKTGGESLIVNDKLEISISRLIKLYYSTIPDIMNG